jgi:hypothetical protein
MKSNIKYQDTATLTCLENNKTMQGEILDFRPAYMLSVSIGRAVKITLRYNTEKKLYLGRVGSLEFSSQGPDTVETVQRRTK